MDISQLGHVVAQFYGLIIFGILFAAVLSVAFDVWDRHARIRRHISSRREWMLGVAGVACLVGIYWGLSIRQHRINPTNTTIPTFRQMWHGVQEVTTPKVNALKAELGIEDKKTSWEKVRSTMFFQDFTATYSRLLLGLGLGCMASILLGLYMGCYDGFAALLLPSLSYLAKVPGTAMLAIFFAIAGTGELMYISMIAFGVLPTLTQAIFLAARDDIHHEEVDKAYTLGGKNNELTWEVVFMQILPKILDNICLQIGPAMVYLIAAEMLNGQVGMGYQIRTQQKLLNMNIVYDYILFLGATGLLMTHGMTLIRERLCPWFERAR
jgi:NitT/TauT family transport system permease protein